MKAKKMKAKKTAKKMTAKKSHKILLVSGGTGGHSFPALSLAQLLLTHGHLPMVASEQRGVDYFRQQQLSCPIHCLPLPSPRGGVLKKLLVRISVMMIVMPAIKLLRREKPKIVVGFGGYMMVPMFLAARLLGIRHVFLEQNAVIGLANRLFASSATAIATGLPQCRGLSQREKMKTTHVGTPIKEAFLQQSPMKKNNNEINIFITGGSQGAKIFADIVPRAMARLQQILPASVIKKITINQQAKGEQVAGLTMQYKKMGLTHDVKDFFHDVPQRLAAADIFIGRAGASTLAEIAVMGKGAILLPFPFATDNHQYYNAKLLADKGACRLIVEKKKKTAQDIDDVSNELAAAIKDFALHPMARQKTAKAMKNFAKENAGLELMKLVIATIEKP